MRAASSPASEQEASTIRSSWHGFLETYEPLRSDLYRYCRHLTRSPWDAEDLAQDALARAFVTLGQMGEAPPNPRAWLFRVASNLWLDQLRRRRREEPLAEREQADRRARSDPVARSGRDAPRAALAAGARRRRAQGRVRSLARRDCGSAVDDGRRREGRAPSRARQARGACRGGDASPGAWGPRRVLRGVQRRRPRRPHRAPARPRRGRGRRRDDAVRPRGRAAHCPLRDALRRRAPGDRRTGTAGSMRASCKGSSRPRRALSSSRIAASTCILHWYAHHDGEAVRAITRVVPEGDRLASLRNYFFNPDFVAEVCDELGVPWRSNGYRWFLRC